MVVAGAIGAVVGGLAGKAASEALNPSGEEQFWRAHFENELRSGADYEYEDYAPAYRLGYEHRVRLGAESFELVEDQLETQWSDVKGDSRLGWQQARAAIRAAWNHIEH
jgi:hypothetical protein